MNVIARIFLGTVILIGLASCDPTYPLFLRNGLTTPITVQTTFDGNTLSKGILRPGERLAFLHTKGDIERIVVLSGDQKLFDLSKQTLFDMRKSVPDPRQVTWNIQSDGIKPLSRVELEQMEKK